MKKRKREKQARVDAQKTFVRGFIATALLVGLDGSTGGSIGLSRDGLRRAIKGGLAIASGSIVADALQQRRYARSLVALATGSACVAITDYCLIPREPEQADQENGEEKEIQQVQG